MYIFFYHFNGKKNPIKMIGFDFILIGFGNAKYYFSPLSRPRTFFHLMADYTLVQK